MIRLFQWYYAAGGQGQTSRSNQPRETAGKIVGECAAADGPAAAQLVPFAIGFNKVVMCRPDMHAAYFSHLVGGDDARHAARQNCVEAVDAAGADAAAAAAALPRVRKTAWFMVRRASACVPVLYAAQPVTTCDVCCCLVCAVSDSTLPCVRMHGRYQHVLGLVECAFEACSRSGGGVPASRATRWRYSPTGG